LQIWIYEIQMSEILLYYEIRWYEGLIPNSLSLTNMYKACEVGDQTVNFFQLK